MRNKFCLNARREESGGRDEEKTAGRCGQEEERRSFSFLLLLLLLLWSLFCFAAFDFLTKICHIAIVNVCVIIILSIVNTQISILLLCFLYLFVELMITMNE